MRPFLELVVQTERRGITQFDMVGFDIDSWG
jgi:hypothetical protein